MHPSKQDQAKTGRIMLVGFKLCNNTINAKHYHQMFQWLQVIKNQSSLMASLLHDNAHYHVAHRGKVQLNPINRKCSISCKWSRPLAMQYSHLCDRIKHPVHCIVTHCLTMRICSVKCVVRRFRHRANVIQCTYTNPDSTVYYTPRLYGIAYCC